MFTPLRLLITILAFSQGGGPRLPWRVEALEMVSAILRGSDMGPNDGWFHAGESRYGFKTLAEKLDKNKDGAVDFDEFTGPDALFDRLDRDRDGMIKAEDFDWSMESMFLRQAYPMNMRFRMLDFDSNGRLTREEWTAFFDRAAKNSGGDLAPDDFREALSPPTPPRRRKGVPPPKAPSGPPPDAPTKPMLLKGLADGEIGSLFEGPRLDQVAPDFELPTRDRKSRHALRQYRGKPVVLVFGSFT